MLERLLDFLYPPACSVCGGAAPLSAGGLFCDRCDPDADFILACGSPSADVPAVRANCRRCGEKATAHDRTHPLCVACAVWPLPITYLRSIFWYEGRIEAAIRAMKYHHQRRITSYFARCLADWIENQNRLFDDEERLGGRWDVLVPVPSSNGSLRSRGYAHLAFITRRAAGYTGLSADTQALRSIRPRRRQIELSPEERFANVDSCFAAVCRRVHGKRILLIDDVLTTGATLTSAAGALIDGGAASVDALTIARSRRFRSLRLVEFDCARARHGKAAREYA